MLRRWITALGLSALFLFPVLGTPSAFADRDDHHHRDRDWDRDRHEHHRYYDWGHHYRDRIYDNDDWRYRYRYSPGYRYYYAPGYDYRDYYSTPWWDSNGWGINFHIGD